jgi:arsenate reductase
MKRILFACAENKKRSQMAEAIFNNLSKSAQATSAGTSPAKEIDPLTIQVLNEIDIKPKILAPKLLENSDLDSADIIVSFGCLVPGMFPKDKFREWLVDDPKTIEEYRKVRDEIREKVKTLISEVT